MAASNGMRKRRTWLRLAFWIVLLFLSGCMLRRFEHNQVYHPSRILDATGRELGRECQDVYFTSSDGVRLNGWFYPADASSPRGRYVVLICHGNGGNISHRLDLYETLLRAEFNVFAFDYRGYGRSEGQPGEEGTYRDAQAAHAWLREKGFEGKNIIAYGESLGGAVAAELCLREPTGGLILQSTFTSLPDIGSELYPWLPVRWLSTIRYDTCRKLSQITVPVLILHSRDDGLIRFSHAERNFRHANEPKLFQEIQGGHNDPLTNPASFMEGIESFMKLVENRANTGA